MEGTEETGSVHRVVQVAAKRLEEAVSRHAGLFAPTNATTEEQPNPVFVRQSAKDLLDTFTSVLREVDESIHKESCDSSADIGSNASLLSPLDGPVDDAMEVVVGQLGWGDARIRSALLGLLAALKSSETIRGALELLPCALPPPPADCDDDKDKRKKKQKKKKDPESELLLELASRQVVGSLESLARRHRSSIPAVLDCFEAVTLHDSFRSAPFRMAVDALPDAVRDATFVSASDASFDALKSVLQTLLSSVRSEEDGLVAWEAIRREMESVEAWDEETEEERTSSTAVSVGIAEHRPSRENLGCTALQMMDIVSSTLLSSRYHDRDRDGCGNVLARSFLRTLLGDAKEAMYDHQDDECDSRSDITWADLLVGDWVGLLVLSQVPDFADSVDQVLDAWIVRSQGGQATMSRPLIVLMSWMGRDREGFSTSSALYSRLVPALLRCAVFLLLAPARIATAPSMQCPIQTFVVSLHGFLDPDRQSELVQCMIHLIDEVSSWEVLVDESGQRRTSGSSKKRRRARMMSASRSTSAVDDVRSKQQEVRRLVNSVLALLVEVSRSAFAGLKEVLFRQLTQASALESSLARKLEDESIQDVCRVVARLVATDESSASSSSGVGGSEVIPLVQELLCDSSTSTSKPPPNILLQLTSPTQMAHRGIQLATELILSAALSPANELLVQNRVIELLLPATRRMVDPGLGVYGLAFFEALMTRAEPSSSTGAVFRHLKNLLSNTGLVQLLHNYQNTPQTILNSVLAYRDVPFEFMPQRSEANDARDMVFCIGYFLKRCDRWHPSTWEETTIWVYKLVNLYLRLGRERASKGWKSQGWLVAPLELPVLRFPSHDSNALAFVETELSRFDVSSDLGRTSVLPFEAAASAAADLDVRKTVDAIVCFALSMWVALGLSAAVLQNSYESLSRQTSTEQPFEKGQNMRLLHFHLLKLQCIRLRLRIVGRLLSFIQAAVARQQSRKARSAVDDPIRGLTTIEEAVLSYNRMDRLFDRTSLIRFDFLLDFFCSDVDDDVRGALTSFATRNTVYEGSLAKDFRRMRLKTVLAEHIVSILDSASSASSTTLIQESHVSYCLLLMKFLTGTLPRLRKGYFASFRQVRRTRCMMFQVRSHLLSF
jgi:hypothetical protein